MCGGECRVTLLGVGGIACACALHNCSLDPRAAIVLDLVPRASAQQGDGARLLNFEKFHSRPEL